MESSGSARKYFSSRRIFCKKEKEKSLGLESTEKYKLFIPQPVSILQINETAIESI